MINNDEAELEFCKWFIDFAKDCINVDNKLLEAFKRLEQTDTVKANIKLLQENKRDTLRELKAKRMRVQWLTKNKSDGLSSSSVELGT